MAPADLRPARMPRTPRLAGRLHRLLAVLLGLGLCASAGWWITESRHGIAEEIHGTTRVAEQMLAVLVAEAADDGDDGARLEAHLRTLGRLRANAITLEAADGAPRYVSPPPVYKAGRHAPAWFTALMAPPTPTRLFLSGELTLLLQPDASRAVLDAWDDLVAASGWVLALSLLAWSASRAALRRALTPLARLNRALAGAADGHFHALPASGVAELDRVVASYNRLVESLQRSHADNRRLEDDQAVALLLQARLEEERRAISRELHDELAQGITAVRAIAGAIRQRSDGNPGVHGSAQAILAMTERMQEGVRAIVQRLRPPQVGDGCRLDEAVRDWCAHWATLHPGIQVECHGTPPAGAVDEALGLAVLRLLQESLTNVARHSGASRVDVILAGDEDGLRLVVADDGRGSEHTETSPPGHFGLTGMHERVAALGGRLLLDTPPEGGLRVHARLPWAPANTSEAAS
ncbi:two-component system sensor histidine kinase UhpB [Azoarcus indigens]|uniref:histidine kinase n=2 Tax=Azoarcus indigens TaxID=29545 RepID=A0A4V3BLN9_9RHOO|nr:two-component system sensor histidine kinase UhpB [Azoarcus indigens]